MANMLSCLLCIHSKACMPHGNGFLNVIFFLFLKYSTYRIDWKLGGSCSIGTGPFMEVDDRATRMQAGAIQPTPFVIIWDNWDCLGLGIVCDVTWPTKLSKSYNCNWKVHEKYKSTFLLILSTLRQ